MDNNDVAQQMLIEEMKLMQVEAKKKAPSLPPPDPFLLKFSAPNDRSAILEYKAQHGCTMAEATAVINLYRNRR